MSFALLIELAWKSSLCAGLTILILALLRGRSAAERSRVAHSGLLVVLMLPLTLIATPELVIETPQPLARVTVVDPAAPSADGPAAPAATSAAARETRLDPDLITVALVGVPAALLLLLTLLAVLRLRALRSRSTVVVNPGWLAALATTQERFGFKHGTALLVSGELSSPISWGVMRPVILLDQRAVQDSRAAEAIIAHELAHVARLDWAKLLIGRAATAMFWFNPLVWMLASRCHELREEAADDAVLRADFARADYAELLVGVARHENRGILLAANGVAPRRGSLSRRIARVLDRSRSRVVPRSAWTLACCAGALLVTAPLAALTFVRQPSSEVIAVAAKGFQTGPAAPSASSQALAAALIQAAERGALADMADLIDSGANPNRVVDGDGTPLIAAAKAGRAETILFLLSRGADVNLAALGDGNPLIAAAGSGRADIVRMLLDRGADIEAAVPGDENALITASRHGQAEVVRLLLARGADVNRAHAGRTPLAMAKAGGHVTTVTLLTRAGATR
jgi:beta-lactamase regulating signal transducer with metallopeptidase domain